MRREPGLVRVQPCSAGNAHRTLGITIFNYKEAQAPARLCRRPVFMGVGPIAHPSAQQPRLHRHVGVFGTVRYASGVYA